MTNEYQIDPRPWREICRACADEQPVWEDASPANGLNARYRKMHYQHPRIFADTCEISTGEVELQVWIDQDGAIKASCWLKVQHSPDQPDGRGWSVGLFGTDHHSEWSFISPETARQAALIALATEAEHMEVRARAHGNPAAIKGAMQARAWAVSKLGRELVRRYSAAEMAEAVAKRVAWLEERRREEDEIKARAQKPSEPDAEESQYALF
jgi:hypothetical protein